MVAADADLSEEAIKAHCRDHLAIYKVPRVVILSSAPLRRTASGKVDRGKFLKQVAD